MQPGIYQGWTGWGNLGDEAMFEACRRALPGVKWTANRPFDAAAHRSAADRIRHGLQTTARALRRPVCLLGGGTIINRAPEWLQQYQALRELSRRPVPVFSPGVANPLYWRGRDGWSDARLRWRDALSNLPEIGVRGPVSKRLLDECGFRNVIVAGDPALMFRSRLAPASPARRAVAVNVGRSNGLMWGIEDEVLAAVTEAVRALRADAFDVRLFPVWDQDEPVCLEVARRAGLPRDAIDPLLLDPDGFVQYIGRFDVAVTLKLHAAVLAAAAGVPFVAVEYRPKVRDFTESVGCGELTFRSDRIHGAELARAVRAVYDNRPAVQARLEGRVRELREIFTAYAGRLEALLLG